ncbi:hypothetical protein K491DRAFT_613866 [Lophiostoma macrostomum CBS 122681]|uniref:Uncharacterized protein n=1 Tax=Lophiostoma macrostomum CBS 122681 TaxID=1314788 RepID=A0A6A6SLM2_9PLEO|nr:hypothetical protein K491DRAFT_613866 [Lophiostoma macrostomum CBS 122681]
MPSFLRGSRSYSFPPCIDTVEFAPPSEDDLLPDIDENPAAHFLTPILEAEDDPYEGLSLSAGIIVREGPRTSKASKFKSSVADKWARYVKQSQPQLHGRYHEESVDDEESFMQLDDARLIDPPHTVSQLSAPPPPKIVVHEPTRGRAQELTANQRRNRRRFSRTLSGHRHSWREPSPDLFTVEESEEEEVLSLRRNRMKKTKDGAERRRSKVRDVAERSRL